MMRSAVLDRETSETNAVGKKRTPKNHTDSPKRPNRTKVPLHVEIKPDLRAAVDAAKKKTRLELNELIAIALEEHLERLGFWPPKPQPDAGKSQ
jgi:hypothetical protein